MPNLYLILQGLLVTDGNLETKKRWNQKLRERRKVILTSGGEEGGEEKKAEVFSGWRCMSVNLPRADRTALEKHREV